MKQAKIFEVIGKAFLALLDDMDKLLNTGKDFLLGKWIAGARANGTTVEEKNLYEKDARDQVTLWGDKESELHEYANKQWAGLIKDFYKPRWELFLTYLGKSLATGDSLDTKRFEEEVKNKEWNWVENRAVEYASEPKGNSVQTAKELYNKYAVAIKQQ